MGTPFIALLEPTPSLPWDRALPQSQPSPSLIPRTFLDAMTVRSAVFVIEQNVPQENEYDADDSRSAHWVIYASVNQTVSPAVTDPATGETIRPRQSETTSVPIGTVRLVPFPHAPHPRDGGCMWMGSWLGRMGALPPMETATATPLHHPKNPPPPPSSYTPDRPTTHHNGTEPYVKLGRLAVTREFRGRGIAQQLILTAINWMRKHPGYFDPSAAEQGCEQLGLEQGGTLPRWGGLICCHAQVDAVRVWERCGFQVDEGMGSWMEEGIPHVGMFLRVEVEREAKKI